MAAEAEIREFLRDWGPEVQATAGDAVPPDFASQFDALLDARPAAVSSVMGLFPEEMVARARAKGIPWFAVVSTVRKARAARDAGAAVIIAREWRLAATAGHSGHRMRTTSWLV